MTRLRPLLLVLLAATGLGACAPRNPDAPHDPTLGGAIQRFGNETGRAFGDTTTGAMNATDRVAQ